MRSAALVAVVAVTLAMLAGCDPRDPESANISEEENALLVRLTRDPFIEIIDRRRNDEGRLIVTTQQGNTRVRYLIAPDAPVSKELKIRRMVEDFELKVEEPDRIGVGPEPRGLP
jgi:hypothetical protein